VSVAPAWLPSRLNATDVTPCVCARSNLRRHCPVATRHTLILPSCDHGLTLVHVSAQLKRLLWDRGCTEGLFKGCIGDVEGHTGMFRVYFVLKTAQVELKSGRV